MRTKFLPILAVVAVILALGVSQASAEENKIPEWIKGVFAYYVEDNITDAELINALEFLIDEGILEIKEKTLEPFSLEKFPQTGGFNPEWLTSERVKILETCADARSMGYENPYCQYVQ